MKKFYSAVRRMRNCQKLFFSLSKDKKAERQEALKNSINYEKEVDSMLAQEFFCGAEEK